MLMCLRATGGAVFEAAAAQRRGGLDPPPPYCCPSPCPYCTLTLSLPSRSTRTRRTTRFTTQSRPGLQPPPPPSYSSTYHSPYCTPFLLLFSLRCVQLHPPGQRAAETCPLSTGGRTRRVHLVRGEGRDVSTQYGWEGGGRGCAVGRTFSMPSDALGAIRS
jgi:hypothetical protein